MDDEVDRRPQRLLDGVGADQPFLGLRPIGGAIGQFLLADDHEDIVITLVLVRRQRRIDPITPRKATEQHDLQDSRALSAPGRILGRLPELVEQYLDDALKLALFGGRKMIDIRSEEHTSELQSLMRISYAVF